MRTNKRFNVKELGKIVETLFKESSGDVVRISGFNEQKALDSRAYFSKKGYKVVTGMLINSSAYNGSVRNYEIDIWRKR